VALDYTVIAGYLRPQVARELGLERVPMVVVVDGDPEYLKYLLIADNEDNGPATTPLKS